MISLLFSASKAMATANSFSILRHSPGAAAFRAFDSAATSFDFPRRISTSSLHTMRSIHCFSSISGEEASAKAAAANADSGGPTIFDKIIAKEIPSSIVYEDENVLAFRDFDPQAPVHVLVIPKVRDGLTQLSKAEARHGDILGQLLYAAKVVAEKEGIKDGFRIVINNGPEACQSVYHLHLHVLGGRQMKWPPG